MFLAKCPLKWWRPVLFFGSPSRSASARRLVARAGIEPATQGFSVLIITLLTIFTQFECLLKLFIYQVL